MFHFLSSLFRRHPIPVMLPVLVEPDPSTHLVLVTLEGREFVLSTSGAAQLSDRLIRAAVTAAPRIEGPAE